MRVWDVHPGYLDRGGLLGQHVEIHAIRSVLAGAGGYTHHPEVLRWTDHFAALEIAHDVTVQEMRLRGFRHRSPLAAVPEPGSPGYPPSLIPPTDQLDRIRKKLSGRAAVGRIPVPDRGTAFWAQHKYSVMARGYRRYRELSSAMSGYGDPHITDSGELVGAVLCALRRPVLPGAMRNTLDHIWGHLKEEADPTERADYEAARDRGATVRALVKLFEMAEKYEERYLLHSTVFAPGPLPAATAGTDATPGEVE